MSLEHFIMPILALIIGIISLFTDPKDGKKKWLIIVLISSLIIATGLQVYFKIDNQTKTNAELSWRQQRITELIKIVSSFRAETNERFSDLTKLLTNFGWLRDKISITNVADVEQSIFAEEERKLIVSIGSVEKRRAITVQYFPKDVDREIVEGALREVGFRLISGRTQVADVPTNSIWFGVSVGIEDVKLVAYTLIRAGVKIKAIRPFRNPTGARASLIQVGADALLIDAPALTVAEIRSTSNFERVE